VVRQSILLVPLKVHCNQHRVAQRRGTHRFRRAVSASRSMKALFGATRSNAKKSATHKQICAAEASSIYGWASFINSDGPDLIELFSSSSSLLCLRYVIDLIDIRLVTISSGSTPFNST